MAVQGRQIKIGDITNGEYVFLFSLQVSGSSMEVGSSDRVDVATAKVQIPRRGPLTLSPQVYGFNFEP